MLHVRRARRTPLTTPSTLGARAYLLAVVLLASSCATQGLNFRVDDRIRITSPDDGSIVRLPLKVAWQAEDLPGGVVVFIDRAPQPPGRSVQWLFRNHVQCEASPDPCREPDFLAEHGIYVTTSASVLVERLPDLSRSGQRPDRHEATLVLLDEDGARVGESAFRVEFEVDR